MIRIIGEVAGKIGLSLCLREDIEFILRYLPRNGTLIEVGTFQGVTASILASFRPDTKIISIDPFNGLGWSIGTSPTREECIDTWHRNVGGNTNQRLFVGTLEEYINSTEYEAGDVIFIDGDHTKLGCLVDLRLSMKAIKPTGRIMGHDYKVPDSKESREVGEALDIFLAEHRCFVEDSGGYTFLVGVLGCTKDRRRRRRDVRWISR